jgi:non-heme chloroperoxidase
MMAGTDTAPRRRALLAHMAAGLAAGLAGLGARSGAHAAGGGADRAGGYANEHASERTPDGATDGGGALPAPAEIARLAAHTVTTSDGVRLNVLDVRPAGTGLPPAPAIVLLPGWCMPASIWRRQLEGLGERWRTLALDPRGQGDSEIPVSGYTADRRADDLHDLLEQPDLAAGRVVLVAWSLGVLEALQYVHRHGSERLHALVLVDNSVGEPPAPQGSDFIARLRHARVATVEAFVRSLFAHAPPPAELARIRTSALRMPLEDSIALLSYPLPREHWREVLHRFDRPLAYVITPRFRAQAASLLAARPASRIEIFENAGHALFVDEPQRFNGFVAGWIDTLG